MARSRKTKDILNRTKSDVPSSDLYNAGHRELCRLQKFLPAPGSQVSAYGWMTKVLQEGHATAEELQAMYGIVKGWKGTSIQRALDGMIYIQVDLRHNWSN